MLLRRKLFALAGLFLASCSSPSNDGAGSAGVNENGGGAASSSGANKGAGGTSKAGGSTLVGGSSVNGGANATGAPNATGGAGAAGRANAGGNVGTGGKAGTSTGGNGGGGGSGIGARGGSAGSGGSSNRGGAIGIGGAGSAGQGGSDTVPSDCAYPAPSGSPVATHGQLKVVGSKIQDQSGQPVQLKGVSSFWLNWEDPKYAESKAAVQYMRDNWKIQLIRVAMGIEVEDGYSSAKAATQQRVDTIVQNAHSLGLYVIVDWHTERAVDQTNDSVAFFTGMADKYGKCPNIIYEDYNEPTKVTWDQIKPYHEAVVKAIRAKDADNLIILGTPDWSSKPDVAAANPVAGTNLLYTMHFYACAHSASSRAVGDAAMSKGVALFISEFGLTPADGGVPPNNKVCESEGKLWFDWMAQNGISGAGWKLVSGVDASNLFSSTAKPPVDGPFPDSSLSQSSGSSPGHGQAIVNWLRE